LNCARLLPAFSAKWGVVLVKPVAAVRRQKQKRKTVAESMQLSLLPELEKQESPAT